MSNDCKEYNSLKYRTLILTGNNIDSNKQETSEESLDIFLNNDMEENRKAVWSKLSKTEKHKKIREFIDKNLTPQYGLDVAEQATTFRFFVTLLESKRLSKNNDITYNREERTIEKISGLIFNPSTRKFVISVEKQNKTVKKKKEPETKPDKVDKGETKNIIE